FDITADLTYANDSVYVDVQLNSLAEFSAGEIVVHTVLIEDKEYSSAPGSNGETEFPDVMRYMFPDVNGTDIGLPAYDDDKMDSEVSEEMELVVFVQNNDDKEMYAVYQLISDVSAPEVTFNVTEGEENVTISKDFEVNFDIAVRYIGGEVITEADTLVYLREGSTDGEDVPSTIIISDTKKTIDVEPNDDLNAQTTYYLGVKTGLEGYNGTPVEETSISFTTGDYPVATATIDPENGTTNVVRDHDITISFDMAVRLLNDDAISDPSPLITFKKDNDTGEDVAFTAIINNDKTIITVDPDAVLDASQDYYISISADVENEYDVPIEPVSSIFTTEAATGIHDNFLSTGFKIYPNPTKDYLNLKLSIVESANVVIHVYNESGQLVKVSDKGKLKNGVHNLELDLSKFDNGLYFVKVSLGGKNTTKKIQIIK
ncbi:Ig-like domain-containing protein, partial [Bacteroidota bacterium]